MDLAPRLERTDQHLLAKFVRRAIRDGISPDAPWPDFLKRFVESLWQRRQGRAQLVAHLGSEFGDADVEPLLNLLWSLHPQRDQVVELGGVAGIRLGHLLKNERDRILRYFERSYKRGENLTPTSRAELRLCAAVQTYREQIRQKRKERLTAEWPSEFEITLRWLLDLVEWRLRQGGTRLRALLAWALYGRDDRDLQKAYPGLLVKDLSDAMTTILKVYGPSAEADKHARRIITRARKRVVELLEETFGNRAARVARLLSGDALEAHLGTDGLSTKTWQAPARFRTHRANPEAPRPEWTAAEIQRVLDAVKALRRQWRH